MQTKCPKCGTNVVFELQGVKLTFKWFLSVSYWARCKNYCTDEIATVVIRKRMLKTERLDKIRSRAIKRFTKMHRARSVISG